MAQVNKKNPRGWVGYNSNRRPARQNTAARAGNVLADLTAMLEEHRAKAPLASEERKAEQREEKEALRRKHRKARRKADRLRLAKPGREEPDYKRSLAERRAGEDKRVPHRVRMAMLTMSRHDKKGAGTGAPKGIMAQEKSA